MISGACLGLFGPPRAGPKLALGAALVEEAFLKWGGTYELFTGAEVSGFSSLTGSEKLWKLQNYNENH